MRIRQTLRCLSSLGILGMTGLLMAGCLAEPESPALTQLYSARDAIRAADQAGAKDRFPDDFTALETRHLQARGTFYACQEGEAMDMAQALITDANALATRPLEPPPPVGGVSRANQPPRAVIAALAESDMAQQLQFDGSGSSDADSDALTYSWDFGDGTTSASSTSPFATHQYSDPGNYLVRLMVQDDQGGSDSTTAVQTVILQVVIQETEELVFFDFDKSTITTAAEEALTIAVREMQENPTTVATIVGHTDSTGSASYNQGLSERRAQAVGNYLTNQGVAADRLSLSGRGEEEPTASNDTKEGRAQNRRAIVTVRPPDVQ